MRSPADGAAVLVRQTNDVRWIKSEHKVR